MVKDHKLKRGKLKGRDPLKNDLMASLISDFREDMKEYGAEDQLVCLCVCVLALLWVSGWISSCFGFNVRTRVCGRRNNYVWYGICFEPHLCSTPSSFSPRKPQTARRLPPERRKLRR